MILLRLFLAFALVGLFTIGGGYAALPLIMEQAVYKNPWLTSSEFSDLLTISEITPGPIAINAATFVGTKVAGIPGAVCATLGFVTPPFLVVSLLYFLYRRYRRLHAVQGALDGLKPAVAALIAAAGLTILTTALWGGRIVTLAGTDWLALILFAAAFAVMRIKKPNQIFVILGCGAVSLAVEAAKSLL